MPRIIATDLLVNGLRGDFDDTYEKISNRLQNSNLSKVMDLSVGATNRQHGFAYVEAAPHMAYWERGTPIPTAAMDSVGFSVPVYEWGRKIPWSKWDRKDDQTQSMMRMARGAGESAALLPERIFFDMLQGSTTTLPTIPDAPDGVGLFSTVDVKGLARFGATNGNVLTGAGTTAAQIQSDIYDVTTRFQRFQDGQGQPLLLDHVMEGGFIIIHPTELNESMDQAIHQRRQVGTGGSTPTNVLHDTNKNIQLWSTPRLTDPNDYYVFLQNAPVQPLFFLDREGVQEFTALEGDNNDGENRALAQEYIQWECRSGGGIALPFACIKVTNS